MAAIDIHSAEWHEARRRAAGASEVAAILGVSPYDSPLSVWARKRGLVNSDEATERMRWGTRLERPILAGYAEDEGVDITFHDQSVLLFHPRYPEVPLGCTPDAYEGDDVVLDAKNVDAWVAREWQDGPPLHLVIQSQTQMAVTGRPLGKLVPLFGGNRLQPYIIERDDRFIASMEQSVADWWARYVVGGEQPPADGSEACVRTLVRLHPDDSGAEVALGREFEEVDRRLLEVKAQLAELGEEKDELENMVKAAIGSATFGLLTDGSRYSWKTQARKAYSVAAGKSRVLRRSK